MGNVVIQPSVMFQRNYCFVTERNFLKILKIGGFFVGYSYIICDSLCRKMLMVVMS